MQIQQTTSIVRRALEKTGYGTDEIDLAIFWRNRDDGNEIHKIFFYDRNEGRTDEGGVVIDRKTGKAEFLCGYISNDDL